MEVTKKVALMVQTKIALFMFEQVLETQMHHSH